MYRYDAATFGASAADIYDAHYRAQGPSDAKLAILEELADGGPIVEIGCATGRTLLALADRGLTSTGVDSSREMLDVFAAKDTRGTVTKRQVDVVSESLIGMYRFAFLLFETLTMDGDLRAQRRCMRNVAAVLEPGGRVLIETSLFQLDRWFAHTDSLVQVVSVTSDCLVLRASRYEAGSGRLDCQEVILAHGSVRMIPIQLHPRSPDELDLLARDAGLRLEERWADWARTPFSPEGAGMLSVYRKDH